MPEAFHIMTKPIGPICNLDCKYCFYLEKENLYPGNRRWEMSEATLETYIRQYIEAQEVPEVSFAWQGGEPTLLGVRFFRRVVELQQKYANGKRITNAFQTNGTLLDDEWGEFLRESDFLVGLSIDGPRAQHDAYRVDKQDRPTFDAVMRGLAVLKKHRVEFNTLTVVNRRNVHAPLEIYRFLKEIGSGFIQFIPLVERSGPQGLKPLSGPQNLPSQVPDSKLGEPAQAGFVVQNGISMPGGNGLSLAEPPEPASPDDRAAVTEWSVEPKAFGEFLTRIFDEWVRHDVGRVFVQLFDVSLGIWMGMGSSLCVFSETCGRAMAMEHNGDVYSCDHYVYPRYKLGNLLNTSLVEMVESAEQRKFGTDKRDTLPGYCRRCEVRFACNGECPKHRFLHTPDGEPGLNYLCAAYKRFFNHIDPTMQTMARLAQSGRAPAEIMALLAQRESSSAYQNAGRNDPCPCGSGRKFKQCCLNRRK